MTRTKEASASDSSGWKPDSRDHPTDSTGTWVAFDVALHRALTPLLRLWVARADDSGVVPRAGSSGDPDEEIIRILGMAPRSLDYRVRPVVDRTVIGFLLFVLHNVYFGPQSSFAGVATSAQAMAAWVQQWQAIIANAETLVKQMTGGVLTPSMQPFRTFGWGEGTALGMPLVQDPQTDAPLPLAYVQSLIANGAAAAPDLSNTLLYDLLRRSIISPPQTSETPTAVLTRLLAHEVPILEDGLRDLIDGLTFRLDAWWTTLPARRLDAMRTSTSSATGTTLSSTTGIYLGAYGYVEDVVLPAQTMTRGRRETGGGFIHAPSIAQASAAAILRSAFDSHRADEGGNAEDVPRSVEIRS